MRGDLKGPILPIVLFSALMAWGCASSEGGSKQARKLDPKERAMLQLEIANAALNEGDFIGAISQLYRAEALDPKNPMIHHAKAVAFYRRNDRQTALESAQHAVRLSPEYSQANTTLGRILMDLGRDQEARPYLLKAANDPVFREAYKAHTSLGILEERQGYDEEAKKYYSYAIQESPNLACLAFYNRGKIHMRSSEIDQALRDFDRASQRFCVTFSEAHLAVGMAYVQQKKYDQAREKLIEVQNLFPNTEISKKAIQQLREIP
jgi:Tfp pilus assembly protein PilF